MKKKKKFFSFSFYFWIAFVVLIVSLFFINRAVIAKTIAKIKDSPSFSKPEIIGDDVKEVIENPSSFDLKGSKDDEKEYVGDEKENEHSEDVSSTNENYSENENSLDIVEPATIKELDIEKEAGRVPKEKEKPLPTSHETRDIEVYFASVNDNGLVTREKCIRSVERSLSPMVDSLNALLKGPTKEEAKHGIRSFIPADTRLLSASIKDEVALINLSDDFQFNRYGVEGYNIQLQQIVFTVCSFPTVKSVQFLIEGQKRDFLGSEGVWIGSPFTVNSF